MFLAKGPFKASNTPLVVTISTNCIDIIFISNANVDKNYIFTNFCLLAVSLLICAGVQEPSWEEDVCVCVLFWKNLENGKSDFSHRIVFRSDNL